MFWKMELTGVADGMDVGVGQREESRMTPICEVPFTKKGEVMVGRQFCRKVREPRILFGKC